MARAGLPTRKPVHHVLPSLDLRPPHPEGFRPYGESECLREAGAQRGAATWWGGHTSISALPAKPLCSRGARCFRLVAGRNTQVSLSGLDHTVLSTEGPTLT